MIEESRIVQMPAQLVAAIHIDTPRSRIQEVMGPGIQEAMAAARDQGVGPVGPWFAHHLKVSRERFDLDICIPVSSPVKPTGRVKSAERPAMRVVRTVYRGPYEGLGDAWHEFEKSIQDQGLNTAGDMYECYLVGPESSQDPADWRTEFCRPILD
ncbi:MAG: GyrI-like domain-containing protein [Pseudomonadota bacterium]